MRAFRGIVLMSVFWLSCSAWAQQEPNKPEEQEKADSKITTRVTLGNTAGAPGTVVVAPVYFTPAKGLAVGRVKLRVTYVSANLTFAKIIPGITADLGNVDLQATMEQSKNDKGVAEQTLTITASFLSPDPPREGIPPGLLGYIALRISEDGRAAAISLRTSAEAYELGSNKLIPNAGAVSSQVEVQIPEGGPIVTCFFFSH